MSNKEIIDLAVLILTETDMAVRINDGIRTVWLPKSQIGIERGRSNEAVISLPSWLAIEKRLA